MDSENLADLKDLDVDCNIKNNVKRASFTCTIENFSIYYSGFSPCGRRFRDNYHYDYIYCRNDKPCPECCEKKSAIIDCHTFNFDLDSKVKFSLDIHKNGSDAESKGHVSLFLQFKEFSCLKILALCKFSILKVDGKEEYKSVVGVEEFGRNKKYYGLKKFINKDDLFTRKSILLPGDRLTVCFEIFYLCDDVNTADVSEATNIGEPLNMFLKDISKLLDSSDFYDCVIKVENSEINVHKCILATRSEVFRSTLKKKLTELESDIIEINDFRLEVVKEMVTFLYTGRSPRMNEMAVEMLEIADKYKLEELKLIATKSLLSSLNVPNACEYLEKSEMYSAEVLKEFTIRYIYLNAKEVVKSERWSRIVTLYPLLLARIFDVAVDID
uniref:BTB domain-containing protein n=1 Tax=Strongyloides papillosus TaxID=174720 RepID=A0A0N5BUM0_STREA